MICRQWLLVALSYYIVRASAVIYPLLFRRLNKEEAGDYVDGVGYDPTSEILQTSICALVMIVVIYSYKKNDLRPIKWMLCLQAIQMVISNWHRYQSHAKADDDEIGFHNFQALNMLQAVFSMIFTIINCILITLTFETNL